MEITLDQTDVTQNVCKSMLHNRHREINSISGKKLFVTSYKIMHEKFRDGKKSLVSACTKSQSREQVSFFRVVQVYRATMW